MDPTNPFSGSLPPPPVWSEDEIKSPQNDANNPFFSQQNSSDSTDLHNKPNPHSTPGGPQVDPSNPFFKEQQNAIQKYKNKKALEQQQQQHMQYNAYTQQQQQQQQQYTQQQQQAQAQAYAAQQAMQQQYYRMASMHNIMAQQQSMHNLNINPNAMNIMAQQNSFRQQMSPHRSPTNPYFNQQQQQPNQQPYYNKQHSQSQSQNMQFSPKTQALNAFKQSLDPAENKDEKKEEKSSEQLKEEKRKRNRVRAVDELISTENTYVAKLGMLNELYVEPMKKNVKLLKKPNHHGIIFPVVIQTMLALNMKLLMSMEKNKDQIGKAIYDFIPYLKMYQNYMNNHEAATRLIKQYRMDVKCEFTKHLIANESEQNGFTLESYLILPIQRIPRYELMLKEIIKLTLDGHEDKENLIKSYDSVAAINKQINVRLKDYETRQKVLDIEIRIINLEINKEKNVKKSSMNIFNKAKRRNSHDGLDDVGRTRLVQPSRIYIKQGHLTKVSRKKDIKYLFILFNDLLIYCSETPGDKLILHQKIDITDEFFRIETAVVLDDDIDYDDINLDKDNNNKKDSKDKSREHSIEIHSIEKSFLCYAETPNEREQWIDAIEKCLDNIKKSGIEQKKNKNLDVSNNSSEFGRFNSAPVNATGSSRFDKMMLAATAPSAIDAAEDTGRILETAPMWVPNDWTDECMMSNCNNKFSVLKLNKGKRNHCRYCGKLVCTKCCTDLNNPYTLPHYEPKKRKAGIHVKVCSACHDKYKVKPLMNVEQIHNAAKSIEQANGGYNASKHAHRPSLKIEEDESKSMISDGSDEWNGLYSAIQPNDINGQSNSMNNMQNTGIKIPQSHTPVSAPQPAGMNDINGNIGMHQASYSNNSMKNMSYINNYNHNPLLQSSSSPRQRKSPRKNNNNHQLQMSGGSSLHGLNNNSQGFPNISPIHNVNNSYSNAFDAIDSNPLPVEKNIFNKKQSVMDVKYEQDFATVSSIIGANDNLINSMDMRKLGGQNNQPGNNPSVVKNKRVSLEFGDSNNKHKKVGNAIVLDENVEVHDSDSDEFAANFNNIVIPDSNKPSSPNEELYGFMASPKKQPDNSLLKHEDVINLDKTNDNVKQLTMFGFTWAQVEDAWKMMKLNDKHKNVVPDHGPLFVETMLDYLNKVQKEKSKSKILNQYNNPDNSGGGIFADVNDNNQKFNFQF